MMWKIEHFLWFRIGVHYWAEKKYKNRLCKLCFKGQIQADIFLVSLVFLSFVSKSLQLIRNMHFKVKSFQPTVG